MNKVFLDTNVVVDFLCEREGFYLPAAKIIVKGYQKEVELYCSSLTFATANYLMERGKISSLEINRKLSDFLTVCQPTPIDREIILDALASSFEDFEDALQYFSAKRNGIDYIVTRDKKGFDKSEIPTILPIEYLELPI